MNSKFDSEKADDTMIEKIKDAASGKTGLTTNIRDHPKLWPRSLKLLVLFNICLMTFNGNFYSAGPSTALGYLVKEFHVGYPDVAPLISYVVLMIGIGCLLWIPTAKIFGKRLVLIAANFIFLAGCIWSVKATSLNSLLGARILGGFGAGAVQAIGAAVIGDVFLEQDYSKAVAMYSLSLCLGAQIGPLFSGHIALNLGWRWIFKINTILVGCNLAIAIPLLPETAFTLEGSTGATAAFLDNQLKETVAGRSMRQGLLPAIKKGTLYVKHPHVRGGGIKQWFSTFFYQFEFLIDPIVLCTGGLWGIVMSWVIVISVTTSQLFAPPPFLFTSAAMGNWTGTSMIGIIIALPIAGPVVDILSRKLSELKGGHQPEYRLYSMIVPFVICSPGLLLFGYTYLKGSYYGPAVGFAMQAAGLTLVPSAVISYAIDSYPYNSAEVVAAINFLTHLMAFALSRTSPQWLQRVGVEKLFIEMSVVQWAIFFGLTIPLIVFGSWIRKKTTSFHDRFGTNHNSNSSIEQAGH
ncbi:major facilitator superfamily domain-containing protein [Dendryphion nanum]|uniref:Major facilitator superfamily domain-containing protein n=1 Tax=Dendryphion nanum TaxID=256645 RepID=A0A9P9ECZ6_9PLEO|nr:major facilitator superfamily domain-containing protein [Dendryphion nanum]